MKNLKVSHTLLLLALSNLCLFNSYAEYTLDQMATERYCACKTEPKESTTSGSGLGSVVVDETAEFTACKKELDEVILPQSETADIYALIKTGQKDGTLCNKKAARTWFKKYRDIANKQTDKMEREILEKICGTPADKKPNRPQGTCKESLSDLVMDTEKTKYYATCSDETGATVDLSKRKQNRLNNKCVRTKTYSKILYTFEGHYFETVCKDHIEKNSGATKDQCRDKIIANAYKTHEKSLVICKNKLKFPIEENNKSKIVCEQYVLSKIVGTSKTQEQETAMLTCMLQDDIESCKANSNVDLEKIGARLKDMYCKAPEFSTEAQKNECFKELISNIEIPEDYNPDACKNITNEDLKTNCLAKEYILSLVDGKDNKHFIVTGCWDQSEYPVTSDEEADWKKKPPVATSKQCDEASKEVYAALEKCDKITPATVTTTDSETNQSKTEINPQKKECINKIEPKFLVNNYLKKLAVVNNFDPAECKTPADKINCLVDNAYSIDSNAHLGVSGGAHCLSGDCKRSVVDNGSGGGPKKKSNAGSPVVNPDGGKGKGNPAATTVVIAGAGALGASSWSGSGKNKNGGTHYGNRNKGKNTTSGSSVGGNLGQDINTTNQGSNWFSFFRDVKMMKKYKKAGDKDCREIYHAAKTKVIGTVVSTAMVVGAGVAAGVMVSKNNKKPEEDKDHMIHLKAAGVLTAGAAGAVLVNMWAVKSARTKLEKASLALTTRSQEGPVDCQIQQTAFFDPTQNYITPEQFKVAVNNIQNASSPMNAYLTYQEWNSYLNNEIDPLNNHYDLDMIEVENDSVYTEETLSKTKQMLIATLEATSNIIMPRAIASENQASMQDLTKWMPIFSMAMQFMDNKTGKDGNESKSEQQSIATAENRVNGIDAVTDANGGIDDCEVNELALEQEKKERDKQSEVINTMEQKAK